MENVDYTGQSPTFKGEVRNLEKLQGAESPKVPGYIQMANRMLLHLAPLCSPYFRRTVWIQGSSRWLLTGTIFEKGWVHLSFWEKSEEAKKSVEIWCRVGHANLIHTARKKSCRQPHLGQGKLGVWNDIHKMGWCTQGIFDLCIQGSETLGILSNCNAIYNLGNT